MELYVSGVKIPKLGSSKDIVLREFLIYKANKEVTKNKIFVQTALVTAAQHTEIQRKLTDTWNDYVNMELYLEEQKVEMERSMQEEYAYWKTVKPKVTKDAEGNFKVSGIKLPENTDF